MASIRFRGGLLALYVAGAAAAAAAAAASPTTHVDMIVPEWDADSVAASVIDVNGKLTTYAVQCKHPADCPQPATIVQGGDVWSLHSLYRDKTQTFTYDYDCQVDRPRMTCTISMDGTYPAGHTTRSTVSSTDNISPVISPIAVTAGIHKLRAASVSATSTAAADSDSDKPRETTAVDDAAPGSSTEPPPAKTTSAEHHAITTTTAAAAATAADKTAQSTNAADKESAIETVTSSAATGSWSASSSTSDSSPSVTASDSADSAAGAPSLNFGLAGVTAFVAAMALL
ncbi:hypothetical protein GMORB2_0589 [Geosmithia morbida]|uniref:Uncharacterized protein n=1 Tax=Geosmithia morbida TaxID=1094350 RepID=A0A9P4Z299_9HYPO|nr:uncharacterized protein GMORB2_0589 [Geosmithia morbida]KAF4126852.1 hypothetical protein GMORB2_0589 [Geosmithia morbida]